MGEIKTYKIKSFNFLSSALLRRSVPKANSVQLAKVLYKAKIVQTLLKYIQWEQDSLEFDIAHTVGKIDRGIKRLRDLHKIQLKDKDKCNNSIEEKSMFMIRTSKDRLSRELKILRKTHSKLMKNLDLLEEEYSIFDEFSSSTGRLNRLLNGQEEFSEAEMKIIKRAILSRV